MPGCAPVDGNVCLSVAIKVTRRRHIAAVGNAPGCHAGQLAAGAENKPLRRGRSENSPVSFAIAVIIQCHRDLFRTSHAPGIHLWQAGGCAPHNPLTTKSPVHSPVRYTVAVKIRRRRVQGIVVKHHQADIVNSGCVEKWVQASDAMLDHGCLLRLHYRVIHRNNVNNLRNVPVIRGEGEG